MFGGMMAYVWLTIYSFKSPQTLAGLVLNLQSSQKYRVIEGSLEVKLPTIWTDEKQSREEAERRERLEERRVEEKE